MITIPGKIPISIHPLFWLLAAFIGWMSTFTLTGTLVAMVVIVISVLFHEFGHALTAMCFSQTTRIQLAVFGGFTYRQGRKLKLWEEFLVVLNGPLAGLLLFAIASWALTAFKIENSVLKFALTFTSLVNLFWTIVNLIPVLPLDGGHLLSIILEGIFGFKGVKYAIFSGLFVAVAVSIFFFVTGNFIVGALFLILTFESFKSLRYYKMMTEKDRDTGIQELLKVADRDFQQGNHEQALQNLQSVREKTKEGVLFTMATQEMAEIYKSRKEYAKAYDVLNPLRKSLATENLPLLHFLAYKNKDYKTVLDLASEVYQNAPTYDTALINAYANAAMQKVEASIGWLDCAKREGHPDLQEALKSPELDPIRQDARFRDFAANNGL